MARVNRTTGFFLVLGVAVLLGTVAGARIAMNPAEQSTGVDTPPSETVFCGGQVDVRSGLAGLVPTVPGKVKEILVREGEVVKAGQVLVRLDDEATRNQLAIAQKGLDTAKAKLENARQQPFLHQLEVTKQEAVVETSQGAYKLAQNQFAAAQKASRDTLISRSRLEEAEIAVLTAKKNKELAERGLAELKKIDPTLALKEHEEALKEAELKWKAAQSALDMYVIKAPSNGRVFEINYQVGGPCPLPLGDANASRAMVFCPDENLIVRAEVDQEWAMMIKKGMTATLTFRAAGKDFTWNGKVETVSNYIQRRRSRVMEPDQFNDSRTRECIIRIDPDPNNPIIHGMRMGVQIHTRD
jgi:multidrug resistance efflux pump